MMDEEYELEDDGKSFLPVDDTLRLLVSPRTWQLQKLNVSKKDNSETWQSFRYYTSLNNALKDIIHIRLAKESFNSAKTFLEASERVINDVAQKFSPQYEVRKV